MTLVNGSYCQPLSTGNSTNAINMWNALINCNVASIINQTNVINKQASQNENFTTNIQLMVNQLYIVFQH